MSAIGLFCTRTTRFSTSTSPFTTKFAFPRHMTTRGINAKGVVNQYQNHIKTVMANSTLDEGQKYRLTKRLTADLDLHIVTHNFSVVAEKIEAAFDRKPYNSGDGLRPEAREDDYR
ncbi:hypothetical protein Q7P36_009168 [Cladosporium allicinum]